jgi:N-sulfoglucosamine sulfohydrolase
MRRSRFSKTIIGLFGLHLLMPVAKCPAAMKTGRPNILFAISDDQSYPHAGAYGCTWVKTPAFDRVATQGILFRNCYTPNAKCAPSRSCILTGRNTWQLEEACNHWPQFPAKFTTFMEVLKEHGYATGFTGKGWAPGVSGSKNGKKRELTGKRYSSKTTKPPTRAISSTHYSDNFAAFLVDVEQDTPWCFWYGGFEPHRRYEYGSGQAKGGKQITDIDRVPAFWPDNETVRNDLLDYAFEIEYFDSHLARMIEGLEATDQLDNTLIVVTADNGMPFPRVKGQEYEMSNHLPLAVMWPRGIRKPGRVVEDFVSFIDLAPTFLQAAGLKWKATTMAASPGKSLFNLFASDRQGHIDPTRKYVVFGKERHDIGRPHDWGYPIRGIVKGDLLYVKNYEPARWPAGNPETGYLNSDGAPTKTVILDLRRNGHRDDYWQMNFGKRPSEELYNITDDAFCINNLAEVAGHGAALKDMKTTLFSVMKQQADPCALGKGETFEGYPYMGGEKGFYERYMGGERLKAGWVNTTDFEK